MKKTTMRRRILLPLLGLVGALLTAGTGAVLAANV